MKTLVLFVFAIVVLFAPATSAFASSARTATASGTGTSRCNGDSPFFPATINVAATSAQGTMTGVISIGFPQPSGGPATPMTGAITSGHINGHKYTVSGQLSSLCVAGNTVQSTISGNCGTGVPIIFEVGSGRTLATWGTFTGNVTCA